MSAALGRPRGAPRRVLGVARVDDPYETTRAGWYVTNLESGACVEGPFRSEQLAQDRLNAIERRGGA